MKKGKYFIPFTLLFTTIFACNFYYNDDINDEQLIGFVNKALLIIHYEPSDINDEFSQNVHGEFLKNLDANKRFFLEEDIKKFDVYKDQIDDQILTEKLDFFKLVHKTMLTRIQQIKGFYEGILAQPLDLDTKENYLLDIEKIEAPKTEKELKERWTKLFKTIVISDVYANLSKQKKDDFKGEIKTFETLEKEAREELLENYDRFFYNLEKRKPKFWLSIFINTITAEFDPHTSYFLPKDKKRFNIQMSGQLEGIGASLSDNKGKPKIESIVVGSPSWKQKELEVGDLIIAVAQEGEKPVNIVGMLLDDSIELIRGKKGTAVTLTVEKQDGSKKDIRIVRDVIELEESFAKSALINQGDSKYGIINLPSFYVNIDDLKNGREAAQDVEIEILKLKEENIEGLILDLRNNGGGSLQSAIDIVGLFIEKGPVVQVKNKTYGTKVLKDKNSKVVWDGPLVVLVNELSASASEIVSAALQDYDRAVIIGSKTYGKGTVQTFIDLDRFKASDSPMGNLKITIQKYYRINGGSVQLKGVMPDVVMPDRYMFVEIGEDDEYNPLVWDKIEGSNFDKKLTVSNFNKVVKNSQQRIDKNPYLKLVSKKAQWIEKFRNRKKVSLNYECYAKELDKRQKNAKQFEELDSLKNINTISFLKKDALKSSKDSVQQVKAENWKKVLSKDLYLQESAAILNDISAK